MPSSRQPKPIHGTKEAGGQAADKVKCRPATQNTSNATVGEEVFQNPSTKAKNHADNIAEPAAEPITENITENIAENIAEHIAERLRQLPANPGVYHMLGQDRVVLYVGKAKILRSRVRSYFRDSGLSPRIRLMVSKIQDIEWFVVNNESEALILENSHIKSLKPHFNILFRDDKSYPYLRLGNETFPRVSFYRGKTRKNEHCFGPYPHSLAVREAIVLMQKVFLLRTCTDSQFNNRQRPCLLYQIKRCSGPCVGYINVDDYQNKVQLAIKYIQGQQPEVFEQLDAAMQKAALVRDYERAAQLRDQLITLRTMATTQRVIGHADDFCDLLACVVRPHYFALSFAAIRKGEPTEQRTIVRPNPHGANEAEILQAFISQRYGTENQEIPPNIWVTHAMVALEDESLSEIECPINIKALPMAIPQQKRHQREKQWLLRLSQQATMAIEAEQNSQRRAQEALWQVAALCHLPSPPLRMECVDISHLSGEGTVASWVVFRDGRACVGDYRRYLIKTVQGGDDYGAMRELIHRRYGVVAAERPLADKGSIPPKHTLSLPDLLVIDGGQGQVNAVWHELMMIEKSTGIPLTQMPVIGLSKGAARVVGDETIVFPNGDTMNPDANHLGFKVLLALRDEAHRFALTGQRSQRKKKLYSHLEDIEGVGPTRRRRLIARFGSVQGVKMSSLEELSQVEGISVALAEKIKKVLNNP